MVKVHFGIYQDIARFAAHIGANNAGCFKLIHYTTCPVIAEFHTSLKQRGGANLVLYYDTGCIIKQLIPVTQIKFLTLKVTFIYVFRQLKSFRIASLTPYEF